MKPTFEELRIDDGHNSTFSAYARDPCRSVLINSTFFKSSVELEHPLDFQDVWFGTKSVGKSETVNSAFTLGVLASTNLGPRLTSNSLTDCLFPVGDAELLDTTTLTTGFELFSKFLVPLPAVRIGQRMTHGQSSSNKMKIVATSLHVVDSIEVMKSTSEEHIYTRTDVCVKGCDDFAHRARKGYFFLTEKEANDCATSYTSKSVDKFGQDHLFPLAYPGDQYFIKREGALFACVVVDVLLQITGVRALMCALTRSEKEGEGSGASEAETFGVLQNDFELVVSEEDISFADYTTGVSLFSVSRFTFPIHHILEHVFIKIIGAFIVSGIPSRHGF